MEREVFSICLDCRDYERRCASGEFLAHNTEETVFLFARLHPIDLLFQGASSSRSRGGQTEGSIEHCKRPILRWILSKLTGGVAGHGSVTAYIRSWGQTVSFDNSIVPDGELTIGKSLRAPTASCRRFELCEPVTSVGDAHYGLGWGGRLGSFVLHLDRGSGGHSWKT